MAQSGPGIVEIFEDFVGAEWIVANTAASGQIGSLRVIGDGIAETDSGVVNLESDGMSGVAQLTTTNEDKHACGISTPIMWDVALMGTLVLEARVRLPAEANRAVFIGFSDVNSDDLSLEDDLIHGNGTTTTLTASDLVGFHYSSEYTNADAWHTAYNGGTSTGETTSTSIECTGEDAVAGDFQVFRVELAPNGTAFFYIDGKPAGNSASVKASGISGAVSTSVDLAAMVVVESKTTTALTLDVDYVLVRGNRDWTV